MARQPRRTEGSIEELPSGRLRVRVYAGRDPLTGKARYLREVVDTERQARIARARMLTQVHERRQPRSDITVAQAIEQWLEVAEHEESTRERNEQLIRLYILPALGRQACSRVDAETLERLYARLMRCRDLCSGRLRGHTCRPLAANSVRKVHFILRAAFDRAVKWKYVAINEAAIATPPAQAHSEPDPPSAAEAAALLDEASRDPEWALLLWLTMITGWRRGEACALRWTDVDLDAAVVTIERSHWKRVEKSTKTHQRRHVAIDDYTVGMLREHHVRCTTDCEALGVPLAADAFVFSLAPDHNVPMLPRTMSQRYRRLAETVGLRSTRLHALRHYSATELIAARVDVRTVAGRLGHGSGGITTLKVYASWSPEADRRAAQAIADIVPRPDTARRQPRAPYEMVASELRQRIASGLIKPGAQLPTLSELAVEHGVAISTVSRAVAKLKEDGLVRAGRGQRSVVTDAAGGRRRRRLAL